MTTNMDVVRASEVGTTLAQPKVDIRKIRKFYLGMFWKVTNNNMAAEQNILMITKNQC